MKQALVALGAALSLLTSPAQAAISQAQTTAGAVQGEVVDGIGEFKGIPFAAPPVGELRWKAPQPPAPWQGVRKTVAFGPACLQGAILAQMGSTAAQSEDCLYIDVWTPANTPADKLPVIAWIYGGGFNSGATSVPMYDGANFAHQGLVLVSLSYRVGPFGFLATPELSAESGHGSGNYGLLDLVAGLRWVHDNIARFGGDPAKVTIMGHSAGSMAVSELVASPLARGLFRGAIAESGANFAPPGSFAAAGVPLQAEADARGKAWLSALGANTLTEARALPAEKLEAAQHDKGAPRFGPVMDGYVIPGDQALLWRQGRFNDVPVLVGSTSDEAAVFGGRRTVTPAEFERQVRDGYGAKADEILAAYPHETDVQATRSAKNLMTETTFTSNMFAWATLQAQNGRAPAYAYYFHRPTDANPEGSGHGSEVPLVFANEDHRPGRAAWSDEDRALSHELQSYWVNFAKTGDPNGPGLPKWPKFQPGKITVMALGKDNKPIPLPLEWRLKALANYYAWRRAR
uniref:carboxylesterase/lipase family protein n=1 Tax=Altererythrobacter segetis TaxID=1104773 RepID=UPI00140E65ED|nr:carboxylesterase family protein [Altererythrobacter segetis]